MTRRDVIRTGTGAVAGAAAAVVGTRLFAQGAPVNPTPPPARDLRYPLPPTWNRELKQLAPNVYAYTQGGGPDMSGPGVSNAGVIVGPDYMLAIDALQGPIPAKDFISRAADWPRQADWTACQYASPRRSRGWQPVLQRRGDQQPPVLPQRGVEGCC